MTGLTHRPEADYKQSSPVYNPHPPITKTISTTEMRPTTEKLRNYSIIGTENIKEPVPECIALTRLYLYQLTYWELVEAYFIKVIDKFKVGLESLQTFYRYFLRVEVLFC